MESDVSSRHGDAPTLGFQLHVFFVFLARIEPPNLRQVVKIEFPMGKVRLELRRRPAAVRREIHSLPA